MSKPAWGHIGAWAEEAERVEAEEREAASKTPAPAAAASSPGFPSLKESVTTGKQKKKTKMTFTLQEFTMQHSGYSGSSASHGLTAEELLSLPTGPKQRSAEDIRSGRFGGGFSNYGSRMGSAAYNTSRPRELESRRSYGYEEDERKGMPSMSRASEFNQPSRSDQVDNWASMKKTSVFEHARPEVRPAGMYSSPGGSGGPGIASRADEVDNWASLKAPPSQKNQLDRFSTLWSGTGRTEPSRVIQNMQSVGSGSTRPETDNWRRSEQSLVLDASRNESEVAEKVKKPNPFGSARPREDVLAEKGLDWKKLDLEIDEKKPRAIGGGSRPVSSQSSRPDSSHSSRNDASVPSAAVNDEIEKPKPKANPFGDAKPREVLLEEKGLDWRKIDLELEHRRVDRTETDEERKLKGDIEYLRNELLAKSGEEKVSLQDQILQKERDLEELIRHLDDKAHYSHKTSDRPSSGSSHSAGFPERPPSAPGHYKGPGGGSYPERPLSQSGAYGGRQSGFQDRPHSRSGSHEDTRRIYPARTSFTGEPTDVNYNERPRSRGTLNSWTKPGDGKRSFQGGGGRGFSGSREMNRSGSRW